jgi:cell wall assembly regulator SMI1
MTKPEEFSSKLTIIADQWQKLSQYFSSFGLSMADLGFRPGAGREEIEQAEAALDLTFPSDYREFLTLCGGQEFAGYDCFFHWLPTDMRFLNPSELVKLWRDQQSYVTEENVAEFWNDFQDDGAIRSVIFHSKRIPIAENEGIATLWLDFIPGPQGTEGQLITDYTECDFVVLARDFGELLGNYLALIEKKILQLGPKEPGYGEGFRLFCPDEKSFEGNELAELFRKYITRQGNYEKYQKYDR